MPGSVPGMGRPFPGLQTPAGPGMASAPMGGPMLGFSDPNDPTAAQYSAVTQADGSILLHLKNPDGSLGPAVKIINPIKPKSV